MKERLTCYACKYPSREARLAVKQRERARKAEQLGKRYRTLPEAKSDSIRRRVERERLQASERALRAARQEQRRRDRAEAEAACLRDHGVSLKGLEYRQRYGTDEHFRQAERCRVRRARARGIAVVDDGTLTGSVLRRLFGDALQCPYCDEPMESRGKSLDHLVPLSKGGEHSILNVVVCCRRCNSRKHARTALEFVWMRGLGRGSLYRPHAPRVTPTSIGDRLETLQRSPCL